MKLLKIIIPCYLFLLFSCTKKRTPPNSDQTASSLQNLQELATLEYSVSKVIRADDNKEWYNIGNRKILLSCRASVKVGIDLKQLKAADIVANNKSIRISLPDPKVLSVNLPPENIKLAYSEIGLFRSNFTSEEKDKLLAQGEKQIWATAENEEILQQAKLNTQLCINNLLLQLGFEKINIVFQDKYPTRID